MPGSDHDDGDAAAPDRPQRPRPPAPSAGGDRAASADGRPRRPVPPAGRRQEAPPVRAPVAAPPPPDQPQAEPRPGAGGYTVYETPRRIGRRRRSGEHATPGPSRHGLAFRVVRGILVFAVGWIVLSLFLFLLSAQIHQKGGKVDALLGGGGAPFTPTNVLVLGTDQRPKSAGDYVGGPARTDTIMLLRTGGFANAKLSVPRDTVVNLPGHGQQKINAAFAFDGTAGTVRAVQSLTGIHVNHVAEMDFANFPGLIDAMGGISYRGGCLRATISGGYKNGGVTLRLHRGDHLDGRQALAVSRVRKNDCNAAYSDLSRGRAQQQVLASIKSRVLSPAGLLRMPLIAWKAPQAVKTDMSGPTLLGVAIGQFLPGKGTQTGIKPSGAILLPDGEQGLLATPADVAKARRRFDK